MTSRTTRASLPTATLSETLQVTSDILIPNLAKGPIICRPRMVALAERFDLDRRAVGRMQRLRDTYGSGPLLLRTPPGRTQAIMLDPEHVHRVLDGSPEPFSTASSEKRAALSHFEPKGALITRGPERAERRHYNEQVLESERPQHRMAETFIAVAREEAEGMLARARRAGELNWAVFADGWFRMVRRVVFGDGARDDTKLRALIDGLRADGNWAFLKPKRRGGTAAVLCALRASPGSSGTRQPRPDDDYHPGFTQHRAGAAGAAVAVCL